VKNISAPFREEPKQTAPRRIDVHAQVPLDALYKCWHMEGRLDHGYYVTELITEVLGGGTSSRLFQSLVKEKKLFSNIECYHFGSIDHGLVAIEGKLVKGTKMETAEKAVEEELDKLKQQGISEKELPRSRIRRVGIAFEDIA